MGTGKESCQLAGLAVPKAADVVSGFDYSLHGENSRAQMESAFPNPSAEATPTLDAYANDENCQGEDVSQDYEAFDNAIGKASEIAADYIDSAQMQSLKMIVAYNEATDAFDAVSGTENSATDLWADLGVEAFWAAVGLVPALGPVARCVESVARNGDFYAKGLKTGIKFLTITAPKIALRYAGSSNASVGDVGSISGLLYTVSDVIQQESSVRADLFLWMRDSWQMNSRSPDPDPWTVDIESLARAMFAPILTVDPAPLQKAMEEVLWREHLTNNVVTYVNNPLWGANTHGFDGLSEDAVCFLGQRFHWNADQLWEMSPQGDPLFKGASNGETRVPRGASLSSTCAGESNE